MYETILDDDNFKSYKYVFHNHDFSSYSYNTLDVQVITNIFPKQLN